MAGIEDKQDGHVPDDNLEAKLDRFNKILEEINKNKKLSLLTTYTGLIVIVIVITVFITTWLSFFNTYNTKALMNEVEARLPQLLKSRNARDVYDTMNDRLAADYVNFLMENFKKSAPLFAEDALNEKENIAVYLQDNIRNRIADNMADDLSNSEAANLAVYFQNKIPPEKLNRLILIVHDVLDKKLSAELDKQLSPAVTQVNDINSSFDELYVNMQREGEFKGITPETVGEVENRLIEALLESIIYELNPVKGREPAEVK